MIKFSVCRDGGGKITGLVIKGHAGYAEPGFDIVCAAVSTALWMAVKGIEAQKLAGVSYEQSDGYVSCHISDDRKPACDALLDSLTLTVTELAKQYRKNIFIVSSVDGVLD